MKRYAVIASSLLVAVWLGGCATTRSVVGMEVKQVENPAQGTPVRIEKVVDARTFQIKPPSPDIPSLKDDDIQNLALTGRAIGRKRNSFGQAMGDVLLPEGQTVAKLTEEALTRAFRESGYRVVSLADPDYAQAVPLDARITQFWSWFRPGFWSVALEFKADVLLQGDLPELKAGRVLTGQARNTMQVVTEGDWLEITRQGLDDLAANTKKLLGRGQ